MSILSGLSFGAPWILAGLAILPAIYWLLRVTPPAPRRVYFRRCACCSDSSAAGNAGAHAVMAARIAAPRSRACDRALAAPSIGQSRKIGGTGADRAVRRQ
jgi:hypothetical protein